MNLRTLNKLADAIPAVVLGLFVVLLIAACLAGCARWDRDPLAAWRVDPDALGLPETTVFVVPF